MIRRLESGFEGQGDLEGLDRNGTERVTAVGQVRNVTEFTATAVQNGEKTDVVIHVTRFTDGDDIVVGAAVHPESNGEVSGDIETMFEAIDH